jgi:hypothetical protein
LKGFQEVLAKMCTLRDFHPQIPNVTADLVLFS